MLRTRGKCKPLGRMILRDLAEAMAVHHVQISLPAVGGEKIVQPESGEPGTEPESKGISDDENESEEAEKPQQAFLVEEKTENGEDEQEWNGEETWWYCIDDYSDWVKVNI